MYGDFENEIWYWFMLKTVVFFIYIQAYLLSVWNKFQCDAIIELLNKNFANMTKNIIKSLKKYWS